MTAQALEDKDLEDLAEAFFALSNEHRLRLLGLLTQPRYREEIADALGMSRQAATKHIRKLEAHGFLRELQGWRESGPVDEYQVDPRRLFALGMMLVDLGKLEPEGGPQGSATERTQVLEAETDGAGLETGGEAGVSPPAHLLVLDGPEAGERFSLEGDKPRWTIGRGEDRDLVLDHDPYISSNQCEIQVHPEGHALVDTYSSNGTYVNFGQLPQGGRTRLEPGDVIGIGRTRLVYQRR